LSRHGQHSYTQQHTTAGLNPIGTSGVADYV
jgi:hypothetical protein